MSAAHPEFSVIIPVLDKWELTKGCLVSLHEHADGHDFEVIVVDNASTDATAGELAPLGESLFGERFLTFRFEENKNFGPACNAGAEAASAPLLFFLNNDTLLTPGWAEPLLHALRSEHELGAVGPLLLYENDTVQHLGVAYQADGGRHLYRNFPRTHPVVSKRRNLQCITGAAMMLGAELFRECGGFYEKYRNGYEDQELCARIRQTGKKLACIPESVIYHLESQTSGRHDGELHNSNLFYQRCGKLVHTDLHIHAENDGFITYINDLLSLSLGLSDAEALEISLKAQGQPSSVLVSLMAENPFWVGGTERVAAICAEQRRHEDELLLRLHLANIQPTLARYRDVSRLRPFFPEKGSWVLRFQEKLDSMLAYRRDKEKASQKLDTLLRRFPAENPRFFERLCEEKIREMFP